jgi:hypothetical protein
MDWVLRFLIGGTIVIKRPDAQSINADVFC